MKLGFAYEEILAKFQKFEVHAPSALPEGPMAKPHPNVGNPPTGSEHVEDDPGEGKREDDTDTAT